MALGATPGGMAVTRNYDTSYALLDQTVLTSTASVVVDFDYGYDAHGFLDKVVDNVPPASGSRTFGYDVGHRLTVANAPALWGAGAYAYDPNGNVTGKILGPTATTYTYHGTKKNRLNNIGPFSFAYDANGNVIAYPPPGGSSRQYFYSDANRLERVRFNLGIGGPDLDTDYLYDYLGRVTRTTTPSPGQTQTFFYTLGWNLLDERVTTGPTTTSVSYIWLGSTPIARVDSAGSAPTLSFYHVDHLGTPIRITSGTGATLWKGEYDAYGTLVSNTGPMSNRLRFPGQFADGTAPAGGLYHNGFRVYEPSLGRYLAVDAVSSSYPTMHAWSPYVYAGGNPAKWLDPMGLAIVVEAAFHPGTQARLVSELETLSGMGLDVMAGGRLREADPACVSGGSGYARDLLRHWINDFEAYYLIDVGAHPSRSSDVDVAMQSSFQGKHYVLLDEADLRSIDYGIVPPLAYGVGMAVIHELLHTAGTRDDSKLEAWPDGTVVPIYVGETVTHENAIRSELGLPERWSYEKFPIGNGLVELPFGWPGGTATRILLPR